MRRAAPLFLVLGLLFIAAPSALAQQRFAAPAGTGAVCTQAEPCSLEQAVSYAEANDEVIVTAGSYTLTGFLYSNVPGLWIHGEAGGPMPTISATLKYQAFQVEGTGSVVSYLDIRDTAPEGEALFCLSSTRVERVRVAAVGEKSTGLLQSLGCTVRDSLIVAAGVGATAIEDAGFSGMTNVARNVTAIATGADSVGVRTYNNAIHESGTFTLSLENSIAQGDKTDLLAMGGFEGPSEIVVAHSNFDAMAGESGGKVTTGAGNQTAAPLFVMAAGGDYHEAPGSPTIDAGVADQLGALDLDGNPRILGPAVDIGAYETRAPEILCDCPPLGGIRSISIKPKRFRPAKGAVVTFTMSGPSKVLFSVSKKIKHKKAYRPLKGSFAREGKTGKNHFTFHGRIGGKTLKPGKYKLTGLAGHLVSAGFEIAGRGHHHH
jgi:hypothetical protein